MKEAEKKFTVIATKKLERSEFEIDAEINADVLERLFKETLKNLSQTAEIAGFRAGKAPENVILSNFGEINILEKAARKALDEVYPEIVAESGVRAIGTPTIAITKLARGNPLGFRARTATMPEIVLGDYKKMPDLKIGKDGDPVTEDEIEKAIKEIQKADADADGTATLPEVNDEFVARVGNCKDVAEFRKRVAQSLTAEKKRVTRDIRRAKIAEHLITIAKMEVPDFFVEAELESMIKRFEHDVVGSGMSLEKYLSSVKKTLDEIKTEWRPSALKKARTELILAHIARAENITPDEERVKKEVDHIVAEHKDADRFQARQYIEHILKNEAVFDFLEKQAS